FRAEDGIRVRNVIGVQTCALPFFWVGKWIKSIHYHLLIWLLITQLWLMNMPVKMRLLKTWKLKWSVTMNATFSYVGDSNPLNARSEERRVGKECRECWIE